MLAHPRLDLLDWCNVSRRNTTSVRGTWTCLTWAPSKRSTASSIPCCSSVRCPSFRAIASRKRTSSGRDAVGAPCRETRRRRATRWEKPSSGTTTGVSSHSSTATGTITQRATASGSLRARALGVTSPNVSTAERRDPDRDSDPLVAESPRASSVAIAEIPILTRVLPTRSVTRTRCGRTRQRCHAHRVARPPFLARLATRAKGSAVRAVSTPEKKAERARPTSSSTSAVPVSIVARSYQMGYDLRSDFVLPRGPGAIARFKFLSFSLREALVLPGGCAACFSVSLREAFLMPRGPGGGYFSVTA